MPSYPAPSSPCRLAAVGGIIVTCLGMTLPAAGADLNSYWESMRLGRWHEAETALDSIKSSGPDEQSRVLYAQGALCEYRRPNGDPEKAKAKYREILARMPASPEAPWALLALARMNDLGVLQSDPKAAVEGYRQVMEDYPSSDAAHEAAIHLPLALWEAQGKDGAREGVSILAKWLADHPHPGYAGIAELELGKLHRYPLENHQEAVSHLRKALAAGLQSEPLRSSTIWTIAALSEHSLGNPEEATEYYTRFLQEFPRHSLSFRAKQALKRLGAPTPETADPLSIAP